jgi:EmrB/QacA subfamily drug resistance transporter
MPRVPRVSLAPERRRWLSLAVVCLAQLMIVLDVTIVNVALPSIQHDLRFSVGGLTWVINAFLVTFGSLLLLAGRLGDLIGRRRIFLTGVLLFTIASALCGAAGDQAWLIGARFLQGIGAALQASVILALIVTEFPGPADRARAMSAYMFVSIAGGSLGLLAGGVLTQLLSWHWIFFVNVPIGLLTWLLGRTLIVRDEARGRGRIDWLGSLLVTFGLMAAVYAIVEVTSAGWGSPQVLGGGGAALLLLIAFAILERRIAEPILPVAVLRIPGLLWSNLVRGLIVTGMYSTFFLGTLYLEHVLHYTPIQTGLAYLPWTVTVAILSRGVNAWMVRRLGAVPVVALGAAAVAAGLLLIRTAGVGTAFMPTIAGSWFLIGFGIGSSFMPLLTLAMAEVPAADAGLASGITNVSQQVAGALGLAILGTVADERTHSLLAGGVPATPALLAGYHLAFLVGAVTIASAVVLGLAVLRAPARVLAAAQRAEINAGTGAAQPVSGPRIAVPVAGELRTVAGEMPAVAGEMPAVAGEMPAVAGEMPAVAGEMPVESLLGELEELAV